MKIAGCGAIVTGGGSGLGQAVARVLAAEGAIVTVLDRNAKAAEAMAQELGGRAASGDVTSEADVQKAVDIADDGQPLRIVVNCAGIGPPEKMVGRNGPMPLANFETVIRVNLIGTFNVMRLAAARIAAHDPVEDNARGAIVNTASVAAYDGQIGQAAYSASKGGIVGMTLPVARELARSGIRVNTIAPGIFKTPLLASLPEEAQESLGHQVPYPSRLGDPAEFADAVRFLIGNQYMNGEVIRLDGSIRMAPK
ncbi:3-hydroxy-2-methylbutyryl-CoA dehydrogenase [Primorskyibacter flagellatus]|uniref:3-hydroxy-2-methylbutyryl-CoA dehydrogenase n=1 Tax=Primorskyibacter flagellatus TaxID=1387277 RepID=A0A916ZVG5_9RHOB|nr:SDR family NAD(P)-dependent oxidoreductase [Primorskyibacter flagellatus]GGE15907.1 3-hydroxy-2-methylbutyryl-CoA dehydrogenase [Primorskyibacter flagellatus]